MDEDFGFDGYDEYGDQDAIDCANGDYNTWEENQVFLDREGEEDFYPDQYDCEGYAEDRAEY